MSVTQPSNQNQIEVRIQPRASRNSVQVIDGSRLRVYLTAPPVDGRANDALVALLARELGVAKGRVRIVAGHRGRDKRVVIEDLTAGEALSRLSAG